MPEVRFGEDFIKPYIRPNTGMVLLSVILTFGLLAFLVGTALVFVPIFEIKMVGLFILTFGGLLLLAGLIMYAKSIEKVIPTTKYGIVKIWGERYQQVGPDEIVRTLYVREGRRPRFDWWPLYITYDEEGFINKDWDFEFEVVCNEYGEGRLEAIPTDSNGKLRYSSSGRLKIKVSFSVTVNPEMLIAFENNGGFDGIKKLFDNPVAGILRGLGIKNQWEYLMSRQHLISVVLMRDLLNLNNTRIRRLADVEDVDADNVDQLFITESQAILKMGIPDKFNYGVLVQGINVPLVEPVGDLKDQINKVAREKKQGEAEKEDLENFVARVKMVMQELGISYKEAEAVVQTRMRDGTVDRQIYDVNLPSSVTQATVQIYPRTGQNPGNKDNKKKKGT
jgi:hypothetical protein